MLKLTNPRLRRSNIVLNSFSSCISDATEEFSGAPKVSMSKMVSEPGVLLHQTESTIAFEQLQGFTNTHGWGQFYKQVDVVNSDMKLIDFAALPVSNLPEKKLTIHPQSIELERIHSILNLPHKVESILSEAMLSRFQIHFSSPKTAHANLNVYFEEPSIQALPNSHPEILNFEGGDSSPSLKTWVSSPQM